MLFKKKDSSVFAIQIHTKFTLNRYLIYTYSIILSSLLSTLFFVLFINFS